MPELPEVEIIRIGLEKKIIGLEIQKIQVLSPKSFQNGTGQPFDFAQGLQGRKVLKVWRKAKILGMELGTSTDNNEIAAPRVLGVNYPRNDDSITLLFHLKMSGQLIYLSNDERLTINDKRFIGGHPTEDMLGTMPNSHTRVIFTLQKESRVKNLESRKEKSRLSTLATSHLYFNDQRKFGWVKIVRSSELVVGSGEKILGKLGPEPLEKSFTWQILKQNLLRHKGMPVKVAIMDQSVISGVGNIYANEACFDAKIDPRTKVGSMSDEQFKKLHTGIIKSLQAGIKYGGSTRVHFVDAEGHKGYFLDYAFVYWRDKHPCKVCGTIIKKIQLGGRGTYLCSHCQK